MTKFLVFLFLIAIAALAMYRLASESLATVLGVTLGILASIPGSLLVLFWLRWSKRGNGDAPGGPPGPYHPGAPVIVLPGYGYGTPAPPGTSQLPAPGPNFQNWLNSQPSHPGPGGLTLGPGDQVTRRGYGEPYLVGGLPDLDEDYLPTANPPGQAWNPVPAQWETEATPDATGYAIDDDDVTAWSVGDIGTTQLAAKYNITGGRRFQAFRAELGRRAAELGLPEP